MIQICFLILASFYACDPEKQIDPTSIKVSVQDISIDEGNQDQNIFIQLSLNEKANSAIKLNINTLEGTAKENTDYTPLVNETLEFATGEQYKEIKIHILADELHEEDEKFTLDIENLSDPSASNIVATVTILNDDQGDSTIKIPSTGYTTPLSYEGMELIWQDEFDQDQINYSDWIMEIGTGSSGWGNNESQYYRKENASIYEDYLVIEAREETYGGSEYTSSRMITKSNFDFKYGRVDIRASLPVGQGVWPALWMLGDNISSEGWPKCGEIDIEELLGHEPNKLYGTAHWYSSNHQYKTGSKTLTTTDFNKEFHVFSLIWTEEKLEWLVDDVKYHSLDITNPNMSEFHQNFFIIFNVAVGGNWPGYPDATTVFPQHMIVDYIRVFQ